MTIYLVMEKFCVCETESKKVAEIVKRNQEILWPEHDFWIEKQEL